MRIKDPQRKKFTSDPVYCMDKHRNEYDGKIDCPLYAVYKDGKYFSVMYWNTSEVASCPSLFEAKMKVWELVTMFDPVFRNLPGKDIDNSTILSYNINEET